MTYEFYLVAKGQCECYLQDENKKERFVSQFGVGTHFGEIALLTRGKRTATI
jgi:CRP-like cAMP-binding protein